MSITAPALAPAAHASIPLRPASPYPSGEVTLLFTDIEGSTKRWEHLPAAMATALLTHDLILRASIEDRGGFVFKTIGDAFCAVFSDPAAAVAAAVAGQRALAAEHWGEVGPVRVRMALHTGEPEHRDRDYFGPPVNRVARILSTGYGEQLLVSATTAARIRDGLASDLTLLDLGTHRLKDLLQPERLFQVGIPGLIDAFPPLKSLDRQPHNLPAQPTPLVGRDEDAARVIDLITAQNARLVTLTGPGGTGKTRLALQVAADLIDAFADGAWFAGLAPLNDSALVIPAIAQPLGVRENGHEPLEATLIDYLRDKQLLLVLDNMEHVREAVPAIGRILAACPEVVILATSRATLRAYGEREVPVAPLALPDPLRLPPLNELAEIPAVELFVERAQAIKPGFDLTDENARAVAGICVRLEGLPLAIELAAARVRILTPEKLLERLANRLDLLTGGASDRDARQQTLRGAIAWSFELLPVGQKSLLRRLSVFSGGATFEAAEIVTNHDGGFDALDGLDALVQQSLVRQIDGSDDEPRFTMLETIREFAVEQLEQSGEAGETRQRHAEYFRSLAGHAEPKLTGPEQARYLEWLEGEHDNLRAALGWYGQQAGNDAGLILAGSLWRFWWVRGHLTEGRAWLDRLIASSPDAPGAVRARAYDAAGALACAQGEIEVARRWHEAALPHFRAADDRSGLARVYGNLGIVAHYQGELDLAELQHEVSLSLHRELGNELSTADVLGYIGALAFVKGELSQAVRRYDESLGLYRKLGEEHGLAYALANLGEAHQLQGDLLEAADFYEQALPLLRRFGDRQTAAFVLHGLGGIALDLGDVTAAGEYNRESLDLRGQLGEPSAIADGLESAAALCVSTGLTERAARIFGAADALRESTGSALAECYLDGRARHIERARGHLGDEAFSAAWQAGRSLDPDRAIAEALAVRPA